MTNNVTNKETPTTEIAIIAVKIDASLNFRKTLLFIPFGNIGSISGKMKFANLSLPYLLMM